MPYGGQCKTKCTVILEIMKGGWCQAKGLPYKPSICTRISRTLATILSINQDIGSWSQVQVLDFIFFFAISCLQIFCRCPVPFQRRACFEGKYEVMTSVYVYLSLFILADGCPYGRVFQKSISYFRFWRIV
jgi:hypothetical protein